MSTILEVPAVAPAGGLELVRTREEVRRALREFGAEVRSGTYPGDEHSF